MYAFCCMCFYLLFKYLMYCIIGMKVSLTHTNPWVMFVYCLCCFSCYLFFKYLMYCIIVTKVILPHTYPCIIFVYVCVLFVFLFVYQIFKVLCNCYESNFVAYILLDHLYFFFRIDGRRWGMIQFKLN